MPKYCPGQNYTVRLRNTSPKYSLIAWRDIAKVVSDQTPEGSGRTKAVRSLRTILLPTILLTACCSSRQPPFSALNRSSYCGAYPSCVLNIQSSVNGTGPLPRSEATAETFHFGLGILVMAETRSVLGKFSEGNGLLR